GYVVHTQQALPDYLAARGMGGTGYHIYRTATNERVMAVTTLLPGAAGDFVAVRMVTSLTLVNQTLMTYVLVSMAAVVVIVLFSVWSGMFFIRSIVRPIGEIEHTAAKMAEGNLDIRIENTYNDEIGKLANTINHMAGELDKSERMKNEFISSVSHELRTPLTSIKGWAETMTGIRNPEDAAYRRGLQVIAGETDRLYDMVEELLDFSRMQNGIKLDAHVLDLVAEVSDSVLTVMQRVQLEGTRLCYEEPPLPVPVLADTARLRQVFLNILDNAAKYSPKNGTITVSVQSDGKEARVQITDEGRGISPEDLENVKIKFFKGKGAVRGSGIGLAVVDEIARAHGGRAEIESELGKGTTVTLCLPVYQNGS
ncbi:MAG: HAMP domain-containing sensor histidine kinase, partial [Ruthenibacterium sp.]